MSRKRRSFMTEYKVEAAHRVIDSGRTVAEVSRDLGIHESLLGRWVADECRRITAESFVTSDIVASRWSDAASIAVRPGRYGGHNAPRV